MESSTQKPPCGLANLGNTCYVNTTLQCLASCGFFLTYVLEQGSSSFPFLEEVRTLLHDLCVERHALMPKRFLNALQMTMGKSLHISEQNDLPEFLMLFVDKLCADVGRPLDPIHLQNTEAGLEGASNAIARLAYRMKRDWLKNHSRDYSELKDMFYGQQVAQTRCDACKYIVHNHEMFFMLTLSLPTDLAVKTVLVSNLFASHMKSEAVHDGIWTCEGCGSRGQSCTTSTKFWRLPDVLVIVLKRFTPTLKKLYTRVELQRTLQLDEYSICDTDTMYHLRSISCHMGTLHGGHYYAVINDRNRWWQVDDLHVREVSLADDSLPFSQDAYVLFYERRKGEILSS